MYVSLYAYGGGFFGCFFFVVLLLGGGFLLFPRFLDGGGVFVGLLGDLLFGHLYQVSGLGLVLPYILQILGLPCFVPGTGDWSRPPVAL